MKFPGFKKRDTTSAEFFDAMYRTKTDPWNFAHNSYEQSRFETIQNSLSTRPYSHAWEPGCSVGVLTERLATLCDQVDACDLSPAAIEQARQRCRNVPGVHLRCASLTDPAPVETYDLIVLSEIGYYFTAANWKAVAFDLANRMQVGATLLASHWLGHSKDHILSGDEVHSILMTHPLLQLEDSRRCADDTHGGFRLERWTRRSDA